MTTLKKLVDGVVVDMSAEESAAMRAEWTANAAKQAADEAKAKEPTLDERIAALEDFAQLQTLAAQEGK